MYRAATSVLPLVGVNQLVHQRRSFAPGIAKSKADIWMKNFDINREFNIFRESGGRVRDHRVENYRNMYWRADELMRRQEKHIQDQGYFFLPTLDFGIYKGCAPLFSAHQMRLHYSTHHRNYVDKLNKLIVGTRFDKTPLDMIITQSANDSSSTAIFNNAAQHFNHMFFWKCMNQYGSIMPPDLENAICAQYGSVEQFKSTFESMAMNFFGSGWMWWVWDDNQKKFDIVGLQNAGCPLTKPGLFPVLCMDLWEHTWYVDYENNKAKYVTGFWQVVDWHWVERHWKRATNQHYDDMMWQ